MPQSSQAVEPLWTDPGIKRGISVHKLISTAKIQNPKAQVENEWSNILPKSSQARKKPPLVDQGGEVVLIFRINKKKFGGVSLFVHISVMMMFAGSPHSTDC